MQTPRSSLSLEIIELSVFESPIPDSTPTPTPPPTPELPPLHLNCPCEFCSPSRYYPSVSSLLFETYIYYTPLIPIISSLFFIDYLWVPLLFLCLLIFIPTGIFYLRYSSTRRPIRRS
jgi:hypothetical protein